MRLGVKTTLVSALIFISIFLLNSSCTVIALVGTSSRDPNLKADTVLNNNQLDLLRENYIVEVYNLKGNSLQGKYTEPQGRKQALEGKFIYLQTRANLVKIEKSNISSVKVIKPKSSPKGGLVALGILIDVAVAALAVTTAVAFGTILSLLTS